MKLYLSKYMNSNISIFVPGWQKEILQYSHGTLELLVKHQGFFPRLPGFLHQLLSLLRSELTNPERFLVMTSLQFIQSYPDIVLFTFP